MGRLIDADALFEILDKRREHNLGHAQDFDGMGMKADAYLWTRITTEDGIILGIVREQPTIDPVRKGEWKKGIGENGVTASLFCSRCNYENRLWYEWNYCPNCGADMREKERTK